MRLRLAALSTAEVESVSGEASRPELKTLSSARWWLGWPKDALGRARSFDLAAYIAPRTRMRSRVTQRGDGNASDHTELFQATETFRSGAEGRAKIENLLRTTYVSFAGYNVHRSGTPQLVRNRTFNRSCENGSPSMGFDWIVQATRPPGRSGTGMRRNLMRSLSLDAFATALEPGAKVAGYHSF